MLIALFSLIHVLPPEVLIALGAASDHVSDFSPESLRFVEHVVFTMMLN